MSDDRPLGAIQVDVDELWVYYESIGRAAAPDGPSPAYRQGIPRLLDLFDRFGIRATFFVCGRDLPAQAAPVAEMVRRGHEVANHSASHPTGFARLGLLRQRQEIVTAHDAIAAVTGRDPVGFKSPGFSFSPAQLGLLAELGYRYDSSILPTPYAPLLRLAQRLASGGRVDPTHYGRAVHGLAPLRPYQPDPARPYRRTVGQLGEWESGKGNDRPAHPRNRSREGGPAEAHQGVPIDQPCHALLEVPVTTMPFLRLPMHSTFVLSAGSWLFDLGLALVRRRGLPVNYLLHAADVIDPVDDPALASYRFLQQSWAAKRPRYERLLARLAECYRLVPTQTLIEEVNSSQ